MFGFFKNRRRARLRSSPFPPAWSDLLESNVRLYRLLPETDRAQLHTLIQIFLAEKSFEGCAGLQVHDEIKLTIASQACLLLLHRDCDIYPRLAPILVYPDRYHVKHTELIGPSTLLEGEVEHQGESWATGVVILSWRDTKAESAEYSAGHNLVLHEFAHQLDREDGQFNGTPSLAHPHQSLAWKHTFQTEFDRLKRDNWLGRLTVIDPYGTKNPAEFFAVCTEAFFEKPSSLKSRHPDLYAQLKAFYNQDPAAWNSHLSPALLSLDDDAQA